MCLADGDLHRVMAVPGYLKGIFGPLIYLDRWNWKNPIYLILGTPRQEYHASQQSTPHLNSE